MFKMTLTVKEVDYLFEESLNLQDNCSLAFFLFRCGFQEKIEPS